MEQLECMGRRISCLALRNGTKMVMHDDLMDLVIHHPDMSYDVDVLSSSDSEAIAKCHLLFDDKSRWIQVVSVQSCNGKDLSGWKHHGNYVEIAVARAFDDALLRMMSWKDVSTDVFYTKNTWYHSDRCHIMTIHDVEQALQDEVLTPENEALVALENGSFEDHFQFVTAITEEDEAAYESMLQQDFGRDEEGINVLPSTPEEPQKEESVVIPATIINGDPWAEPSDDPDWCDGDLDGNKSSWKEPSDYVQVDGYRVKLTDTVLLSGAIRGRKIGDLLGTQELIEYFDYMDQFQVCWLGKDERTQEAVLRHSVGLSIPDYEKEIEEICQGTGM